MTKEYIAQISSYAFDELQTVIREAKERLSEYGLRVGAEVRRDDDGSVYRITRIDDIPLQHTGFFLYGLKLRKDGTYGTHEHSIDSAIFVTPLSSTRRKYA